MLVGDKVKLRHFKLSDYIETLKIRSDAEGIKQLLGYLGPVSIEKEKEWVRNIVSNIKPDCDYFVIEGLTNTDFVGYLSLKQINQTHKTADFGIYIMEAFRGKGYAKEAINILMDYCKYEKSLRKIKLSVLENNTNAVRLYEILGFICEGTLKEEVCVDGKYVNLKLMSKFLDI